MSQYSCYYGLFLFNSQITVFMMLPGILTVWYDRILPVCLYDICDIDICSLYGSLLFYSIDNNVVDYDISNCLSNMLYVLWLVIFSNLCRGGYTVVSLMPLYMIIINVHDPDLILLVYMLSVAGRLATLKWYYSKKILFFMTGTARS